METSRFRPYDVDVLICNYERASRLLNWKPEISIREGLKETIEWIKKENFTIKSSYTERYGLE